jgi:DNA repair exonuclease SbcCD ATPase subunit
VVFIEGQERDLDSSVSGGQYTSIELAVDLAVSRVVSQRLGCNLQWIVLDEAFNGHDPVTKEACMSLLQQYAADKLVVIVDHSSEFKEMFTQEIVVEKRDRLSWFKGAS